MPGLKSSVLGFGCASVLGAVDAKTARVALHAALDAGITHFDLARSYGYGEAEEFVGGQLAGVRDNLVLVTKFGIQATAAAALLGPFKPVLRLVRVRQAPPAAQLCVTAPSPSTGRLGGWLHRSLPMTAATMRGSLERSLRALRTDRVDFLLMHEPPDISHLPALRACADELKREGKIRGWGLASFEDALPKGGVPGDLDVWQTSVPAGPSAYQCLQSPVPSKSSLILFSPLRGIPKENASSRLRQLWHDFPRAVVLCSMFNPTHIKCNAASVL